MPYTNFPFGVTSFGMPIVGGSLPPFGGNWFWVNDTTGSDGNTGGATDPLKTLDRALALCTAGNNDVVLFSGTIPLTAALAWNKAQTHLIGLCAPLARGKRARIASSGATPFTYLVNVTAAGCWFANFGTFYGFPTVGSTTPVCWYDAGGRNNYDNVEFLGFGDATSGTATAAQTTARALKIANTGECTFRNCWFGTDTATRNATNYTIELTGGAARLQFDDCTFGAFLGSSGAAAAHVLVGASGIDREMAMNNCRFWNATLIAGTVMNQVFVINADPGGWVNMHNCSGYGMTNWETSASGFLMSDHPLVVTQDAGISVLVTP